MFDWLIKSSKAYKALEKKNKTMEKFMDYNFASIEGLIDEVDELESQLKNGSLLID